MHSYKKVKGSKTYLIAKIGKSIKFNENSWSLIGGDNEITIFCKAVAQSHPDDKFIMISSTDYDESIPNLFKIYNKGAANYTVEHVKNALEGIKIDGIIVFSGLMSTGTMENSGLFTRASYKAGTNIQRKGLECFYNYCGPIVKYLNDTNLPWMQITTDPRHFKETLDLLNSPIKVLSQFGESHDFTHVKTLGADQEIVKDTVYCENAGVQQLCLCADNSVDTDFSERTEFNIFMNEGMTKNSRYNAVNEFIFSWCDNCGVYGKWTSEAMLNDSRFKAAIRMMDIPDVVKRTKYTFIVPIKKGWVTAKYLEMLQKGILPFMHPDYDSQHVSGLPEFLYVGSPIDLQQKIAFLEANPDEYVKLLTACQELVTSFNTWRFCEDIMNKTPKANVQGTEMTLEIAHKVQELDKKNTDLPEDNGTEALTEW